MYILLQWNTLKYNILIQENKLEKYIITHAIKLETKKLLKFIQIKLGV